MSLEQSFVREGRSRLQGRVFRNIIQMLVEIMMSPGNSG